MGKRDYYEVLGVKKNATDSELKKQFRRLSKEYHPDKQVGKSDSDRSAAEEKFKEINEAYNILSDKDKRMRYDQFGHDLGPDRGGGPTEEDIDNIFNDFLNRTGRGQKPQGVPPIAISINLNLKEIFNGGVKKIKYDVNRICQHCKGEMYVSSEGGKKDTCTTCHGSGYVQIRRGPMLFTQSCPSCNGSGHKIINGCKVCNATGFTKFQETVEVEIPKGVPTGANMVFDNKGNEAIIDGKRIIGKLVVYFQQMPDKDFIRDGNDLHCVLNVPIYDCILGEEVSVTSIDQKSRKFKLKVGTESEEVYRLKGIGMPIINTNNYGDLYVHIKHIMPKTLTNEEIKLLKEIREKHNNE